MMVDKFIGNAPSFVRRPTKQQVLDVLQDPTVYIPWGIYAEDVHNLDDLVLLDNRVLLQILDAGDGLEVHICCKRRDRADVREVILAAMDWLRSCGVNKLVTTAPKTRVALTNLLKSLGFCETENKWVMVWDSIQ